MSGIPSNIGPASSLNEQLAEIKQTGDELAQANALVELACQMMPARLEILEEALAVARTIDADEAKAQTLLEIAPQLKFTEIEHAQVLEEALKAAESIQDNLARISFLARVASQLSDSEKRSDVVNRALAIARSLPTNKYFSSTVRALAAVAPLLPEPERFEILDQALTATQTISGKKPRCEALEAVAPHLTEPFLDRALAIAEGIPEEQRNRALASLAPHLPNPQLEQALEIIQRMEDPWYLATALVVLASYLPESLIDRAITIAQSLQHPWARAYTLGTLAAQLPEPRHTQFLQQALSYAQVVFEDSFASRWDLSTTLRALAVSVPQPLLWQVLEVIQLTEKKRTDMGEHPLVEFASQLKGAKSDLLERTLALIQDIPRDRDRAQALINIAANLPESEALKVLEQASVLAHSCQGYQLLIEIANHLSEPERLETLEQVLTTTLLSKTDRVRKDVLKKLLPYLPERLLRQSVAIVKTIQTGPAERAQILASIAAYLPENDRLQVLELALESTQNVLLKQEQPNRSKYIYPLLKLVPQLPIKLLEKALETARSSYNNYASIISLRVLSPYLPQTIIEKAWSFVEATEKEAFRAATVEILAPYLPTLFLEQALETALAMDEKWSRIHALAGLSCRFSDIPNLSDEKRIQILEEIAQATHNMTDNLPEKAYGRNFIFRNIQLGILRLIPTLVNPLLNHIQNKLDSENKKYHVELEKISPYITRSTLPDFLEATLSLSPIEHNSVKIEEILALPATYLTEHFVQLFPEKKYSTALNTVRYIVSDADKVKFLSAFFPRLSSSRLVEVLKLIELVITDDFYRTEALKNLLPYLSNNQLLKAFHCISCLIHDAELKTSALESFISYFGGNLFFHWNQEVYQAIQNLIPTLAKAELRARILYQVAVEFSKKESNEKFHGYEVELLDFTINTYVTSNIFNLTKDLSNIRQTGFSYEKWASKIFTQLAPTLRRFRESKEQQKKLQSELDQILEGICQFQDSGFQAEVLAALPANEYFVEWARKYCPYSPTASSNQLLRRFKIQLKLPFIGTPKPFTIFEALRASASPYILAEALVELSQHPKDFDEQREALDVIRGLTNSYLQAQYLQSLIPALKRDHRLEAASVINDIEDPYYRVVTRVTLAQKFPESEFFIPARDAALALKSRVQKVEQLSNLAIEMPELLPRLIKIAEEIDSELKPESLIKQLGNGEEAFSLKIEHRDILIALAPHLPIRINLEVHRESMLGHFVSPELYHRALYVLARSYRDALQSGTLRNDAAQNTDLLDLKDEINALSGLLLMRDLEPPMAVGILGGWGGGKSYIMHLMQARMTEIRSRRVDQDIEAWHEDPNYEKLSPYVGHIYQIKFDAWTFAKSDLWASLMQTIFVALNRQITLEQQLFQRFEDEGIDPNADNFPYGDIWKVLYEASDTDRTYFLQQVLKGDTLRQLSDEQQSRIDTLLWDKRETVKQLAVEDLEAKKGQLTKIQDELDKEQEKLDKAKKRLETSQQPDNQALIEQINQVLVVSSVFLKNRIGNETFKKIQNGIEANLKNISHESFRQFQNDIRQLISNVLEGTDQEGNPYHFSRSVIKQWAQRNLAFIVIFCIFALASVLAPWIVIKNLPDAVVPQIIAFITPFLPALGMAQKLWKAGQKWYDQTKQALLDCENQIQESQAVINRETRRFQQQQIEHIATLKKNIEQLEQQAQSLDQQVKAVEASVPENVYASLNEFVAKRIEEGQYDRHLGLMHCVKEDLNKLSERLLPPKPGSEEYVHKLEELKKVFPRGPARVVVYIDDLDRCPPDCVVQVLEAVQLLVKTPLFIAVLAIDERYITRTLEKFYSGVLLRRGSPSGTDYLEKIIQIPYRVRPITDDSLENYLRAQVSIQDNATSSTKFSEFSSPEFNMLIECCNQVVLSPRALKRLTNVYKLFKIVCRTRGTRLSPSVQKAILALLALSSRYPDIIRGIFDNIENCYEAQRSEAEAGKQDNALALSDTLQQAVEKYQLPAYDKYLEREFIKLRYDALHTKILPPGLTLKEITHKIFDLIRSFSFIGEIGEDPEDYRYIGAVASDNVDSQTSDTEGSE